MNPKLTVSGYRGIWGNTLTPEIACEYVQAYGKFVSEAHTDAKKILVGRDGRESGPVLTEAVITKLLADGFDVVDLGMMPTPVVLFLVRSEKADGAIIITASHNPIEYNGLKFVTASGSFTTEDEVRKIEEQRNRLPVETVALGQRHDGSHLFKKYLSTLLSHSDVELIKSKNFKVALDPINSVGCTTTPELLDALGATYTIINGEPTGRFAHAPEPIAQNLQGLSTLTLVAKCDIGFAQDPDGDRLVLVDETGTILSEELTLALSLRAVLAKTPGDIVVNAVTSNIAENIATSFGVQTFRSKVGEANVVEMMRAHSARIGGEGSGGVIWPTVNAARDSYVGIALILELMAKENKSLSEIVKGLPQYFMVKEKVARTGDLEVIYAKLRETFPGAKENTIDGLRLDLLDETWVSIRPSNTEPIIRIFAEAKTAEGAKELATRAQKALS